MAKSEKTTRERIVSSSYFLGCFGFSRKIYSQKLLMPQDRSKKTTKKKTGWFSWSKLRLKNGEIKPSPLVDVTTERSNSNSKDQSDKQNSVTEISRMTDRIIIPRNHKTARMETPETKTNELEDLIPDNSEPFDELSSSKDYTCQKRVFSSVRGKPDRSGSNPTSPAWIQRSYAIPATEDPKKLSRVKSGRLRKRNGSGGKFDPIVGLSIVMLTLVIMIIWGRLCAVLCTSAWCYFLPCFRKASAASKRYRGAAERGSDPGDPDLDSESYKRKVVFQGFLERKNRIPL